MQSIEIGRDEKTIGTITWDGKKFLCQNKDGKTPWFLTDMIDTYQKKLKGEDLLNYLLQILTGRTWARRIS